MLAAPAAAGCVIFARPLEVPPNDQPTLLLVSGGLAAPMSEIARHPWFAGREAGASSWQAWEVGGGGGLAGPFDNSPYVEPILHMVWRGEEAQRGIECLRREAPIWLAQLDYLVWPGPNSNTFGDAMLRACDLHASLPATSVGRDFLGVVGVAWSTEGTGFQFETPLIGFRIGLREGIELHILGLAIGIDLWPPAIIVPLGPGRIGFADR